MANGITDLSTATFDETINSADTAVIVDFWAEWCGPCKKIAPILEEILDERDDLAVAKVNADEQQELVLRYNVMSIPTLLVFDNGELAGRIIGAKGKAALLQEIDEFLATSR